jgi:hypothetical protein
MGRPPAQQPWDWLLGARLKRQLLAHLFCTDAQEWAELKLARSLHANERGTLDKHLRRLVELGLAEKVGPRRFRIKRDEELSPSRRAIRRSLSDLLRALEEMDEEMLSGR